MFEQLFGSKTRVKLLTLFLNNPNRPYYVREITRKVDEQINSVRRELSNLLAIGIIKSDSANNRLYYEVDQKYQFYAPLRSIFTNITISEPVLQEAKEDSGTIKKLRATGNVQLAFLTGVFVRDQSAGTDLFIMGDVNRARVAKLVAELEKDEGREVNFTVMSVEDYKYRLGMNDRFLAGVLGAKKILLIDETKTKSKPAPAAFKDDVAEVSVPIAIKE